jgi:hypothetical protein
LGCISTATCSGKHSARMPIDYFKRLLEKDCQNQAYPVRHKLKDCDMMSSFMNSGSLTWGTMPDEGPDRSDAAQFPEENTIMTVFEGCPLVGRCRMSNLGPRIPTPGGCSQRAKGVTAQVLHSTQIKINIYIYILTCVFTVVSNRETNKRERGSVPWTGAGVQLFLQAFEDKGDRREGILSYLQKIGDVLIRRQAQVNYDTGHMYESPR